MLSYLFDGGVNGEEQVSGEVLPVVQVRQVLNKLLTHAQYRLNFCIYFYLGHSSPGMHCYKYELCATLIAICCTPFTPPPPPPPEQQYSIN